MQILLLFEKVVAAEGEKKASLALKEASDIIDQSGCRLCYQLSTQQVMQYPYSSESYIQKIGKNAHCSGLLYSCGTCRPCPQSPPRRTPPSFSQCLSIFLAPWATRPRSRRVNACHFVLISFIWPILQSMLGTWIPLKSQPAILSIASL